MRSSGACIRLIGLYGIGLGILLPVCFLLQYSKEVAHGVALTPFLIAGSLGLLWRKAWGLVTVVIVSLFVGWYGLVMWGDFFEEWTKVSSFAGSHGLELSGDLKWTKGRMKAGLPSGVQAALGTVYFFLVQIRLFSTRVIPTFLNQEGQGTLNGSRRIGFIAMLTRILTWVWGTGFGLLAFLLLANVVLTPFVPYAHNTPMDLLVPVVGCVLLFVFMWAHRKIWPALQLRRTEWRYRQSGQALSSLKPLTSTLFRGLGSFYLLLSLTLFMASFPFWKAAGDAIEWTGPFIVSFGAIGWLMWRWSFSLDDQLEAG